MSAMSSGEAVGPPVAPLADEADSLDPLDTPQAGSRALRGGSLRTVGYVVTILLSLVAVPLLIKHLGISGYGRYVLVISLVAIVASLTEGGLNAVAVREYTTTTGPNRRQVMRVALGLRIALTTAGALLAIGFAAVAGYGSELVLGTALAGVGMIFQLVQGLLGVSLEAELRFGWVAVTELLRQLVNVLLLVALVLAHASIVLLLGAAIPASLVSLLMTVALVRGNVSLRPAFAVGRWWPLVRDSIPWAIVSAVNVVYFRLVIILMSLLATATETGYFATSFRVVEVLIGIPALTVSAAYPILTRTVRGDGTRFAYASGRLFELSLILGTWMVVCLEIGAPFAIKILAGGRAEPSVAVLRIQGLAVIATFVAVGCGFPLLTLRRFRQALLANCGALVLSGVLTAVLVGPLGARGAAIAAVAAEYTLALSVLFSLLRAEPAVRIEPLAAPGIMLAGAAAVGLGLLLPVHPVIGALIASGFYFIALRLIRRFPPEVAELIAGGLRSVGR